ncbi:hypothetical protein [Paraglaciecola psychrophila]|uniref:Uncharacterized protein n=1 Tax=Paraglaciecola psychrophila 170 TaxID=1129794 RepID=K7AC32_9ALTE|nr:hypothetical protein [Paraglaciecola psychrophila]AGH42249.1 hypothetical protein C427_0139 [Paraglaciecola psychrophila 170]GAC38243.1 hypothetical protein GPSY_2630 [Paraglaciecola psychrophila 170]
MLWRFLVFILFVCSPAQGFDNQEYSVSALYQKWLLLQVHEDQQLSELTALAKKAETLTKQYPLPADCWALQGMTKSQQANVESGFGGLRLVKQAKDMLQKTLSIDTYIFYGVAYAELSWLYHRTPGWPFSFGSDKMARHRLN